MRFGNRTLARQHTTQAGIRIRVCPNQNILYMLLGNVSYGKYRDGFLIGNRFIGGAGVSIETGEQIN